ncbi:MAG: hypothetical protein DI585_03315 [Pseudomonas fluorescens]|nr:MAG: hypothetical protein DI585_03315 [Pseudomonas fluorescens]
MRKYHKNTSLFVLLVGMTASVGYAADAVVPVPPEAKTTQLTRTVPCAVQKVEGHCEVEIKLEEFGLNNLTLNITTPALTAAPVVPKAILAPQVAGAVVLTEPAPAFSATQEPITVESIQLRCGYSVELASRMIAYHSVYTGSERQLIALYWDWEWYEWACSKLYAGRHRYASFP